MGERSCAEIHIGGVVRRGQVRGLCRAIQQQGVSTVWGGSGISPRTANDLLAECVSYDGVSVLRLCDDQASWGQFDLLEAYLQRARIPFTRRTDGTAVYDGEQVDYRPGLPIRVLVTNGSGQPVVAVDRLDSISNLLESVGGPGVPRRSANRLICWALKLLKEVLPDGIPPLPSFMIADRT